MSALGQKQTFAPQSACLLCSQERTFALHLPISAKGQKQTFQSPPIIGTPCISGSLKN